MPRQVRSPQLKGAPLVPERREIPPPLPYHSPGHTTPLQGKQAERRPIDAAIDKVRRIQFAAEELPREFRDGFFRLAAEAVAELNALKSRDREIEEMRAELRRRIENA